MTYISRCPKCGQVLRGGHGDPIKRIESPICYCKSCGATYIDDNNYEWAVLDSESQLYYYYFANNRWILYIISLFLAYSFQSWVLCPVLILLSMSLCYWWVNNASKEEIEKSRIRCYSTAYIDMLVTANYSHLDQRYRSDYVRRKKAELKPPGKQVAPKSVIPPPEEINTGLAVARGLWLSVRFLCDKLGITPSIRHQAYIWTALLYAVAKTFRSQSLVDDIYSNFQEATKSHFRDTLCGADPYLAILGAYREYREVLNKSRIDPRSEEGLVALWYMVRQWAYPDQQLPENAFDVFSKSCSMALFLAKKDISKSRASHETKYSISEMDCTLPEHT